MYEILTAVIPVAVIGIICASVLVIASKLMAVKEDERLPKVRECLPGANCGACGFAGCDGYAEALCEDSQTPANRCVPGGEETARRLSEVLGVDFSEVDRHVAVVHCAGDCTKTKDKVIYKGINSCEASKLMYGGKGSCIYGCLGLGDCVRACPQNAIRIENGVASINTDECIGCGICVGACPNHIISLVSDRDRIIVTCSNRDKGALTRKVCDNGCIGCKKCERHCPMGAIRVKDHVAVIEEEKCAECSQFGICAQNCSSNCIRIVRRSTPVQPDDIY